MASAGAGGADQALILQGMKSTLWLQTSAEYEALTIQAYAAARRALPEALADKDWSAIPGSAHNTPSLPPAIIMDIDETVLSNARFQGELIKRATTFNRELFKTWTDSATAPPVPGAPAFIEAAEKLGIHIFFVTNRDASLESATRTNLERRGFPLESGFDNVLMRNEKPGWTRDKESRRALVAHDYRVIMIVGDDLNDFTSAAAGNPTERRAIVEKYADFWGLRWSILPNPAYGSWEQALYGFRRNLDAGDKLQLRRQYLQGGNSPAP